MATISETSTADHMWYKAKKRGWRSKGSFCSKEMFSQGDAEINGNIINLANDCSTMVGFTKPLHVRVVGKLKLIQATVLSVKVHGDFTSSDSTIKEDAYIEGELTAIRTIFQRTLCIKARNATLTNSSSRGLLVKAIKDNKGRNIEQNLYLKEGSTVGSTIRFEGGEGFVFKDSKTEFSGELIGAHLIEEGMILPGMVITSASSSE